MRALVLFGGRSSEREVSLESGQAVAVALRGQGHEVTLADPWDGGVRGGAVARALLDALQETAPDVVVIALHGGDGEDGTVQAFLEMSGVPYTGSGVSASALGMDKALAKELFRGRGVPTPAGALLSAPYDEGAARAIARTIGYPLVTKPNSGGSTVGASIVREAAALERAFESAWRHDRRALVETFVPGRELTVGIMDGEAFPVVEILPESGFYDYEAKYTPGRSSYVVPAELDAETSRALTAHALDAYEVLGCAGVARVDFRLDPDAGPFCLEVNTVPGLTATSLVPKAAAAVGVSFEALCERILTGGVERR